MQYKKLSFPYSFLQIYLHLVRRFFKENFIFVRCRERRQKLDLANEYYQQTIKPHYTTSAFLYWIFRRVVFYWGTLCGIFEYIILKWYQCMILDSCGNDTGIPYIHFQYMKITTIVQRANFNGFHPQNFCKVLYLLQDY